MRSWRNRGNKIHVESFQVLVLGKWPKIFLKAEKVSVWAEAKALNTANQDPNIIKYMITVCKDFEISNLTFTITWYLDTKLDSLAPGENW